MKIILLSSVFALALASVANAESGFSLSYKYEDGATNQIIKNSVEVQIPSLSESFIEVPKMKKTLAVIKLTEAISTSLIDFQKTCDDIKEQNTQNDNEENSSQEKKSNTSIIQPPVTIPTPIRPTPGPGQDPEFTDACLAEKVAVADALEAAVKDFENEIPKIENDLMTSFVEAGMNASKAQKAATDLKMNDAVELNLKLVGLMREAKPQQVFAMLEMARSFSPKLAITTGGAQDARKFRDTINNEEVPKPNDFVAYGYINEFDLAVEVNCDEVVCSQPKVAYDADAKKIYVQAGLGTNVTEDNFARRPLNMGILIDISGSMSATDNTDKTRLEWAKEAVRRTLENLVVGQDFLTISTFTNDAKQVWPAEGAELAPITQEDKEQIKEMLRTIETSGSTNLRAGLTLSYDNLKAAQKTMRSDKENYEHRVVMVTDANLNYGDTDESGAVVEVDKMSRTRGINTTVIGVGLNFFQDFVNNITMVRGGNYIFAQNGQDMVEYFDQFDTLVTPAAYDFVADFEIDETKYKFVKAHGVPEEIKAEGDTSKPTDNVIDISTLFFVRTKTSGGGARVLEFDVID